MRFSSLLYIVPTRKELRQKKAERSLHKSCMVKTILCMAEKFSINAHFSFLCLSIHLVGLQNVDSEVWIEPDATMVCRHRQRGRWAPQATSSILISLKLTYHLTTCLAAFTHSVAINQKQSVGEWTRSLCSRVCGDLRSKCQRNALMISAGGFIVFIPLLFCSCGFHLACKKGLLVPFSFCYWGVWVLWNDCVFTCTIFPQLVVLWPHASFPSCMGVFSLVRSTHGKRRNQPDGWHRNVRIRLLCAFK